MAPYDQGWVTHRLFDGPGKLREDPPLLHQPPQPPPSASSDAAPRLVHYFCRRLFLWMPRKMWRVDMRCT